MNADTQRVSPQSPQPLFPRKLISNPLSLIGVALAAVAFVNIVFLFLIDVLSAHPSPYIGILAYMVAPGFLFVGLNLILAGIAHARWRAKAVGTPADRPILDFNSTAQRSTVAFVLSFVVIFSLMSALGSYKAYEYTESVQFCGQLCHTVMHPEFTAYQASSHARVACVDCHVGSGAGWYVKSKVSGLRQVYYTARGTYPRPIPSPVHNLRPAPETCEQCHWPKKFWGAQLKTFTHFSSDERNTPRAISLLIKTGGGDPSTGQAGEGIHWHMNIANKITYFATDQQRQVIPWVRVEDAQGHVTDYSVKDNPPTHEQISKASRRRMDCVDCHNRPAHVYAPPDLSVDQGITGGSIDAKLPFIKREGVQVLTADYKTTDAAQQAIAETVNKFYKDKYPEISSSQSDSIRSTIAELQRIYRTTFFPEMKVSWQSHPNNIGHFYFQGCFRCHDGNHVSEEGKVISKDCNSCHTVIDQQEGRTHIAQIPAQSFKHPVDLGDLAAVNCSDCHNGGVAP